MTGRGLYLSLALTLFVGSAQATSLLDYYEASMGSNLDERPKMARPWEGVQLICPSEDGVFENTEECFNFFSYLCKLIGNSESNCSEEYNKKCLSAINSICEERDQVTTDSPFITRSEPTTINEITTEEVTKPTGLPETTCPENDLDCIIDDTGVTPDWFKCPEDIGSYPHPLSNKLFIFCINWKPSVKRCAKNLVYSVQLRTCVNPGAEFAYNLFSSIK